MQAQPTPRTLNDLLRLFAKNEADIDIGRMNLLCAQGLPETHINLNRSIETLDRMSRDAEQLAKQATHIRDDELMQGSEAVYLCFCLSRVLKDKYGVHYCEAEKDHRLEADWRIANRHFIHGCLGANKHGTCASLPILFIAVGRRLGYPLYLARSPGHFYVKWSSTDERLSMEFNGDFELREDGDYRKRPVTWPVQTIFEEGRRAKKLYLRTLDQREVLAEFLAQRGHCLQAHRKFHDALRCYEAATRLDPDDPRYRDFCAECVPGHGVKHHHRSDLELQKHQMCHLWGITFEQFCNIVEGRLRGEHTIPYPWEQPNFFVHRPGRPYKTPFEDPEVSDLVHYAVEQINNSLVTGNSPFRYGVTNV